MKYLLIFFLFYSCNKVLYYKPNSDNSYKQLTLLGKKNSKYRGVVIFYNDKKGHWCYFNVINSNCDTIYMSEYIKDVNKKNNTRYYYVSKAGNVHANLSSLHLELLADLKKTVDSLGWCVSDILANPGTLYVTDRPRK